MCLLTFLRPGVLPDTAALRNGAWVNDDGHGFAVVVDRHITVRHGLDPEAMIDAFDTLRRRHPHGPALFHSRFTTHGRSTLDNCHPFLIGGDRRTVLAHNGILPTTVHPTNGDPRSDTRIAAEDFLPAFGSLRSRRNRLRFQRWLTPGNKVVILTVDRRFKQQAYILNEESGIWDGGVWYSNDGYRPPPLTRWTPSSQPRWAWQPWDQPDRGTDRCCFCDAIVSRTENHCQHCGWCLDCGEMPEDCLCYTPADPTTTTAPPTYSWSTW
jgi:hypothetical protein